MPYTPDDFNAKGELRLPLAFWLILILQSRTWILFIVAGASRQQGDSLLKLFYPDTQSFWLGLAAGVPAVMAFLLSGRRQQWPRLWAAWRWVLMLALWVIAGLQIWTVQQGDAFTPMVAALLLADLLALIWLAWDKRLRACFRSDLTL